MHYRSLFALSSALYATVLLTGCSAPDASKMVVGNWVLRQDSIANHLGKDSIVNSPPDEQAKTGAFYRGMTLAIRPDKTYTILMGVPMEGAWSVAKNAITLTIVSVNGRVVPMAPSAAPQTLTGHLDTWQNHLDISMPSLSENSHENDLGFEKSKK